MALIRLILIWFILVSITSPVLAKEKPFLSESDLKAANILEYQTINPNLLVYPFKRLGENIKLFFIFDKAKKGQYLTELYDKRFSELVYIINYNKVGFIGFSVDRYNTLAGTIKNNYVPLDKNKITKYIMTLEKLRDRYHSGNAPWEKIQQAIDTTKSLI